MAELTTAFKKAVKAKLINDADYAGMLAELGATKTEELAIDKVKRLSEQIKGLTTGVKLAGSEAR